MNLILLDRRSDEVAWPADDPRCRHVREVLRMAPGDVFFVGVEGGPRGRAEIVSLTAEGCRLAVDWGRIPVPPMPVTWIVGMPRPQTARRLLREAASLGVSRLRFFHARRGEPSYAESRLWRTAEWARHLREGAEQAFTTHIPAVDHDEDLAAACASLSPQSLRVALDVYEASVPLGGVSAGEGDIVLALGPERGWDGPEREVLLSHGFTLAHLGARVLRTETAAILAQGIVASRRGWLDEPIDL